MSNNVIYCYSLWLIKQNYKSCMKEISHNEAANLTTGLPDLSPAVSTPPAWLHNAMSIPREEGFVTVDNCDIHFFRWGNPKNPGVVMLHGFLAHARCFAFIAPLLAKNYHVVAYDISGMGDSGQRDQYTYPIRIKELLVVCEKTGLFENGKKPFIVAHSYGGRVSTEAVHAHPDTFAGLIICDLLIIRPSIMQANADKLSPPGNGRDPNQPNRIYADYEQAKNRFVLAPPQKVEQEYLLDFMAHHSLKQVEGGWQWKFDPKLFNFTSDKNSPWGKTGPKLMTAPGRKAIVYGEQSMLFIPDSVDYLNELANEYEKPPIPCIGIPDARHHLMLDQPIAFACTLKSILAEWNRQTS